MADFNFYWPTRFVFGAGKVKDAGKEAARLGRKALLVTGRGSVKKTGVLGMAASGLRDAGIEVVNFEGICPNPRADMADGGGKVAREEGCDFVLGLGGGSVMDAAKAIAVSAVHPGSVWEYMNSFTDYRSVTADTLPLMEIPTVSGTGSEGNATAVISNAKTLEKSFIKSDYLFPVCAVIDPELTFTVPPDVAASSGADIVCHVLEPYINGDESFEASLLMTESFMKTVINNLPAAVSDGRDLNARSSLAWVSTLCCSPFRGLGLEGSGSLHHIEHSVSGRFDVSHGEGLCALLPSWLEFMEALAPGRLERLGLSVFGRKDAVFAVKEWLASIGMGLNLGDLGVPADSAGALAEDTIRVYGRGGDYIPNGKFRLYAEDIERIYRGAF